MGSFKLIPSVAEGIDPGQLELEIGTATFDNVQTDVAVRTRLSKIEGAWVTLTGFSAVDTDQGSIFSVPLGKVTDGTINIARSVEADTTDATVCYLLVGTRATVGP